MAYIKQNFKSGDVLTATHLNIMENGIVAASKDFNFWADKTMVCVGDSITAGSGTTQTYWAMLKEILGLSKMTGMGVGGSCVSAKSDYGTGNSPLINRYTSIPEADLITIFMGTNDWGHETPLGTIDDTTDVSFYGALNVIIPGLMKMYPNSRIIWITPMHRYKFGTSKILGTAFTYDHIPNGRDCTLKDYVDAIKEVCERYSIPVIDLFSMSGLHPSIDAHKSTYMPDGLHPNKAGHAKMAYLISKWLQIYANIEITSTDPVAGVELDITSSPLPVGQTITINSSVLPITASNKKVTWSIKSGTNYASITSQTDTSCVVKGIADGKATIVATTEDGGFTAECVLDVTSNAISVTGITAEPETSTVAVESSVTLTASILPEVASNKNVSWLIVSGTEYVSIAPNGLSCTVTGISEGQATVSVTSQDGNFTKECDITVVAKGSITTVTMDYGNPKGAGDQQTSKARLHSASTVYLDAGVTISLKDTSTYKWACALSTDGSWNTAGAWLPSGSWTTADYTTAKAGQYGFVVLKADESNFDLSANGANLLGTYFTIL
jgi:lysophospholipase L1-like esterase